VNGTPQVPIEGVSLAYTFDAPKASERHTTQYFEIAGNRAIYHNGWLAGTIHRAPWEPKPRRALQEDVWELYDTRADFSLAENLAAKNPKKLAEMQALFTTEAVKHHVLPIDDRSIERFNPAVAGRPDLIGPRTTLVLYEGMPGMLENTFINVKNRSSTITAELVIPPGGANGVILAQGGRFSGWSLYLKDGRPAYTYNFLGLERTTVSAQQALAPGKVTLKYDFAYDGGGLAKGGVGTLSVDGRKVGEGRIERTIPMTFSGDETADVGMDSATPVVEGIGEGEATRFTGTIEKVTVEVR
jgi:arylsulfatase